MTLQDVKYSCDDFTLVAMNAGIVFRWWKRQKEERKTERLFVGVEGLEVLLYNNNTVTVLLAFRVRSQGWDAGVQ